MIKPDRLRQAITQTIPDFKTDPDKLVLQFDNGTIHVANGVSPSFEYHYELEILALDFPYHPDLLFVPIIAFLRREQNELLANPDHRGKIQFEIDRNNNQTYDIYIKIPLTERVIVKEKDGNYEVKHGNEPLFTEHLPIKGLKIYLQNMPEQTAPELIWEAQYE